MQTIKLPKSGEKEIILDIDSDQEYRYIFLGKGEDKLKLNMIANHRKPEVSSRIEVKAVVLESASFDMEGMLKIHKGATDTDTYLKIDCLLIGEDAKARAVPSLEIEENDVKASHGATIGAIDDESLNYISSRGLNRAEAQSMIIESFLETDDKH